MNNQYPLGKKSDSPDRIAEPFSVTNCFFPVLRTISILTITALLSLTVRAQNENQAVDNKDWLGSYYFSETARPSKRRRSGDVVPSAGYEITVEGKDDLLFASFAADGVQLFEAYDCSVIVRNNNLEFYFRNLGSPDVQNFRRFKKGDLLFTLSRIQTGKTTKYLFQPAAYKIIRPDPAKQGMPVYFDKPNDP